mmetsp:Transcript_15944/g.34658  ORF Transcript_15944/g.34658 Transcript_15944/m.34658 type:complete len:138 (-) Transcript_15944:224-637(-)
MGAAQSSARPAAAEVPTATAPSVAATINEQHATADEPRESNSRKKKNDKASQLTGFHLVQYKCRRKKKAYDACYNKWYGSTITVGRLDDDARENCDDLFEAYQHCILLGMKKDRDRRGLGKANEDSAIGTFEAEVDE